MRAMPSSAGEAGEKVVASASLPDGRGGAALVVILLASLILKLALLVPAHATYPVFDAWDYFRIAHVLRT
jgi:hypothetical protein